MCVCLLASHTHTLLISDIFYFFFTPSHGVKKKQLFVFTIIVYMVYGFGFFQ